MGVRTYNCYVEDGRGRPVINAWCRAWNISDPSNPVLVETQYTDVTGKAAFVALPDDAPVDVSAIWSNQFKYFRNVISNDGDDVDTAVDSQHTQNTDAYAKGYRTGTSFPSPAAEGECFIRTDL